MSSDKSMNEIMQEMHLIAPKKEPAETVFIKIIYNWHEKTQQQIYKILELEVEFLKRQNPALEFTEFSKPVGHSDGSILYKLTFKKK